VAGDDSEGTGAPGAPEDRSSAQGGEPNADDAGLLESLLNAFDERERRGSEARGGVAGNSPSNPSGRLELDPTEAIKLRALATDAESDIAALIKVAIGDSDTADDASGADEDVEDANGEAGTFGDVTVGEEGIDETLFEELSEAAEETEAVRDDEELFSATAAEAERVTDDLPVVDAEESNDDPIVAGQSGSESDEWLTDIELEERLAEQPDALASDADTESVPDPLTTPEMEEVLDADAPAEAVAAAASFDALFEDRRAEQDLRALAGDPRPAEEVDSLRETTVIEEIGSENVAAGAAADVAPAAPPPAVEPEPAAVAEPAPVPARGRPAWLPPSPVDLIRAEPLRAAAAIAAAILAGVASFLYLATNYYRTPDPALINRSPVPLDRAIRLSGAMMDERDYAGAVAVLDRAIAAASATDPRYADAAFQRLDARMALLPEHVAPGDANAMHSAIDDAILYGRQHRRTSEALMWKAQVYEREGNVAAARAEYRGILEDYGNAPNRDEVLLKLGQLELRTDRPMQAIQYARQLIAEYPRSSLLSQTRLLLGDASAAAGDLDGARIAYIRLAEGEMDSSTGALAFERLGKLALDEGEPSAAIRELQSRLRSATTVEGNERVYLVLARAHRASGEPNEARSILNELLDFFPESDVTPLALVELAQVLVELGSNQEAVRLSERAVERFPNHPEVLRNAAALYAAAGKHAEAGKLYFRAHDAGAATADVLLAAGRELELADSPAEARAAFERVVIAYPASPEAVEAHIGWARASLDLGDINGAYTRLNQIVAITEGRPRQLPVLRALAGLYGDLGLRQELVATYGKVAAVTDEPAPLAEAAQQLIESNAVDQGIAIARRVEIGRLEPAQAYPFLNAWGRAMLRGDAEVAIELLQRAHDDYPAHRTAAGVETLMQAVLARGRTAQARTILAEMQSRADTSGDSTDRARLASAAAHYGDYLLSRNDYAAAAEAYAVAAAQPNRAETAPAPTDTEYWNAYQRANALFALGRVEESLALYDFVGKSAASVARDARARGDVARVEKRRADGRPAAADGAAG
jgi:tetratricopeptide (TPR) repeat protein